MTSDKRILFQILLNFSIFFGLHVFTFFSNLVFFISNRRRSINRQLCILLLFWSLIVKTEENWGSTNWNNLAEVIKLAIFKHYNIRRTNFLIQEGLRLRLVVMQQPTLSLINKSNMLVLREKFIWIIQMKWNKKNQE